MHKKEMYMYNLDFLRIYLVLSIVYGHMMQYFLFEYFPIPYKNIKIFFTYKFGYAVEMLFVLSGFLFYYSSLKRQTILDFIVSKWIRLGPVIVFAAIVYAIFSCFGWYDFDVWNAIFQCLLLSFSGPFDIQGLGYLWYIGVMFVSMVFYFYLLVQFKYKYVKLIMILIVYFSYTILVSGSKFYSSDPYLYGIFLCYLLRGLAGVGAGYFVAKIYEKVKSLSLSLSTVQNNFFYIGNIFVYTYCKNGKY